MTPEQTLNRRRIVEMSYEAKTAHLGSALSAVDIIEAIFSVKGPNEKFILSNGHAAVALYAVMERYGILSNPKIAELGVHPDRNVDLGIEVSTGSLGQGLPIAVGMALADRGKNVYCCVSDGECAEGSVWEALRIAQEQRLDNLKVVVNANGFDASDPVDLEMLFARLQAQGCPTLIVDGHDLEQLTTALELKVFNTPLVIFAKTSVQQLPMLSGLAAHYRVLDKTDLEQALTYLAQPTGDAEELSIPKRDEFDHLREIGTRFKAPALSEQLRRLCEILSEGQQSFHLTTWFDSRLARALRADGDEWIIQGLDISSPEDEIYVHELLTYFLTPDGSVIASKMLASNLSSETTIEKVHQLSRNLARTDPAAFRAQYRGISYIGEIGWLVREMQQMLVERLAKADGKNVFCFEHWGRTPEAARNTVNYFVAAGRKFPELMAGAEMRVGTDAGGESDSEVARAIIEALSDSGLLDTKSKIRTNRLVTKLFNLQTVRLGEGFVLKARYDLSLWEKSYLLSFKENQL